MPETPLLLGSSNPGKLREMRELLAGMQYRVVAPAEVGLRGAPEETGTTFTGNLSWIPYMILFVALIAGGAITWKARGVRRRRKASS